MSDKTVDLAKKTFLAMSNPYGSVQEVFPNAIDESLQEQNPRYVGVKNQNVYSEEFLLNLRKAGFILHTVDKMAMGGRAVDLTIKNPITGQPMTGSSSGTAVNIRIGINDLGIGTDGGGSVLMPALSLNLYGIISKLIAKTDENRRQKHNSTDGIPLVPSVGFIARDLKTIIDAVNVTALSEKIDGSSDNQNMSKILIQENLNLPVNFTKLNVNVTNKIFPSKNSSRPELIDFCNKNLEKYDVIISNEGPIDVFGTGDSIIGHMGDQAKEIQDRGNKFISKVVNMVDGTGIVIPTQSLGTGILILTKSTVESAVLALKIAETFPKFNDTLVESYFMSSNTYFSKQFGYPSYRK